MKIIRLSETDSTNHYLRQCVEGDEEVVVTADFQTAGRGQGTNTWESERGQNLLFSMRVGGQGVAVARQFLLSMAHALAVHEALSRHTGNVSIKWPNDIYWLDKKIAGTLIEVNVGRQGISSLLIGTGINVNQEVFRSNAPNPVSLRQIVGHSVDREQLLHDIVESQQKYQRMLAAGEYKQIVSSYHERLYRREGYHPYRDAQGPFEAQLERVADDGRLLLIDKDGRHREYRFKEVQFII